MKLENLVLPDSVQTARLIKGTLNLNESLSITTTVLNAVMLILLIVVLIYCIKLNKKKSILIPDYTSDNRSYDNLLHDVRWYKKRATILARDNSQCQYCGSYDNLQIHHKYYSKYPDETKVYPWDYPNDALITLCDNCHKRVHKCKKIKVYYRKFDN